VNPDNLKTYRTLFIFQDRAYIRLTNPNPPQTISLANIITNEVLTDHLNGKVHIGAYPGQTDKVKWGLIDFDTEDKDGVKRVYLALTNYNFWPYIEISKSKGYHIWIFFDEPVKAVDIRNILLHIIKELGIKAEVFPKQDRVNSDSPGNGVFLPLQGKLMEGGRTVFVDNNFIPYQDQWDFLSKIRQTSNEAVQVILEKPENFITAINKPHEEFPGFQKGNERNDCIDTLIEKPQPEIKEGEPMFETGHRNNDLFHTCFVMARGGATEGEIKQIAEKIGLESGLDLKEIDHIIKSAIKKTKDRNSNLTEDFRLWIANANGTFTIQQIYTDLCVTERKDKDIIRHHIKESIEKKIIERSSTNGVYRKIDQDTNQIVIPTVKPIPLSIKLPGEIEEYVKIFPGNIIIVAGTSDGGKTAYALNLAYANRDKFEVVYFSSEMVGEELRERIDHFEGTTLDEWNKIFFEERTIDFQDKIRPNALNIIDYLEVIEGEFFKVGNNIRLIFEKLDRGTAVICLQKNFGAKLAQGAEQTLAKARLYVTIENNILKIIKGKNRATKLNPAGLTRRFHLIGGIKFVWDQWQLSGDDNGGATAN
jgi:hypothetical protein